MAFEFVIKGKNFGVLQTMSGKCSLTMRGASVDATGRKAFEKLHKELDELENQMARLNNWEEVWSLDWQENVAGGDKDAEQAVGEA